MKIIDLKTFKEIHISNLGPCACCVGNFDGVHLGHKALIEETIKNKKSYKSAAWSFEIHPQLILHNNEYKLITTNDQKLKLLSNLGLDYIFLESYTNVYNLSKEEFINDILIKECKVQFGVCGYNFKFGYKAEGNSDDFVYLFKNMNIETSVIPQIKYNDTIISSTLIKALIENGDVKTASLYLGHPYSISSKVEKGKMIGRTIEHPTINQIIPSYQIVPKPGVYKSNTIINGTSYPSITNVGTNPTIDIKNKNIIIETHILNFDGDLYNQIIDVEFIDFIRDERKFNNLDELKLQIQADIKKCLN